jgi:L-serine dehydratase
MDISIFDVLGPVMIGPSSSHTAGAARLSRSAREIVKGDIAHISFGLYDSFAETYKGHGTDKALLAGALGLKEDDEGIVNAYELARQRGMEYDFYKAELNNVHENTVKMTIKKKDGSVTDIIGSSIGGGQILITSIDGYEMELSLQCPTIVIMQYDRKGLVTQISGIMTRHNINIANMKLIRKGKGDIACCIIETDETIPEDVEVSIQNNINVVYARVINIQ